MVKKEGVAIAGGYGLIELLQTFGRDGGAIAPEQLTILLQHVNLPTIFILGVILWFFRSVDDDVKVPDPPVICPYAPKQGE